MHWSRACQVRAIAAVKVLPVESVAGVDRMATAAIPGEPHDD